MAVRDGEYDDDDVYGSGDGDDTEFGLEDECDDEVETPKSASGGRGGKKAVELRAIV